MGLEKTRYIHRVIISPENSDIVYVGVIGSPWGPHPEKGVYKTTDGGETRNNLSKALKGVPEGSWIPQVHASKYRAEEAFVVVNNYRRNDYSAYLYHTLNFGKTWERIVDDSRVWGYVLSFEQDPVEPKLMFLGTEYGLYISIDAGANCTKWTNGYPIVSTMDMIIHPCEYDLVIGTFGRAAYVLDDIRPLREIAQKGLNILEEEIHVFDPPEAVLANNKRAPGFYSAGDAYTFPVKTGAVELCLLFQ